MGGLQLKLFGRQRSAIKRGSFRDLFESKAFNSKPLIQSLQPKAFNRKPSIYSPQSIARNKSAESKALTGASIIKPGILAFEPVITARLATARGLMLWLS
jgi:hypothetical protein